MISSFVLLSSAWENFWLLIFVPTIVMAATIPLWFVKQIPSVIISMIYYLGTFGYALFIFIGFWTGEPGFFGALLTVLLIFALNGFQFKMYRRYFKNHRCENCGSMHLRVLGKNIDGFERTNVTHYINSETKEKYLKKHTHVVTNTTYYTYCPDCNSLFEWTEEDEENFHKDTRPEDLRD